MTVNTFYEKLYSAIENNDKIPSNKAFIFQNDSTSLDQLNAAGNLKIGCTIPYPNKDLKSPNYMELVLNQTVSDNNVLGVVSNLIKSDNFICSVPNGIEFEYKDNPDLQNVSDTNEIYYKSVKWTNLKNYLDTNKSKENQWKIWNLNYNRNYDNETVRKTSAKIMKQLNDVIQYVIDNDLKKPDAKFRELIKNVFSEGNGSNQKIYSYAHNTLLLPTLIDLISKRNNDSNHSLTHAGYVMKGSEMVFLDVPETNIEKKESTNSGKEGFNNCKHQRRYKERYGERYREQYKERYREKYEASDGFNQVGSTKYNDIKKWYLKNTYATPASLGDYIVRTNLDLTCLRDKKDQYKSSQLQQIGEFNYPFSKLEKNDKWTPSTINLTSDSMYPSNYDELVKNVGIKYSQKQDPYKFEDSRDSTTFAKVTMGMDKEPEPVYGGRPLQEYEYEKKDKINLPICWEFDAISVNGPKTKIKKGDSVIFNRVAKRTPVNDYDGDE